MKVSDLKPRGIKPPMWLLPFRPLRAIVSAMEEGACKYAPNNWRDQGSHTDFRETYSSAAMRHLLAFIDPDEEDVDRDSGVHHLAHLGACVLILLYLLGVDYVVPNARRRMDAKVEPSKAPTSDRVLDSVDPGEHERIAGEVAKGFRSTVARGASIVPGEGLERE